MRQGITQKIVFEAACDLIGKGSVPTQDSIREYLGRGSRGTIHKYLKQWKQACFEQGGKDAQPVVSEETKTSSVELQHLEQQFNKQTELNKMLSQDLLKAEREIAKFREQQTIDQKMLQALRQHQAILERDYEKVNAAYDAICLERQSAIEKIIQDKNRLLETLQEELKETNRSNLIQIRDWTYQKEDELLQEKVKNMNYEEQLKTLKEELKKISVEYENAKNALEPLRMELAKERKKTLDQMSEAKTSAENPLDDGHGTS